MGVEQIPVRNPETGAEALLPETALPHFPAWERIEAAEDTAAPEPPEPETTTADGGTNTKKGARRG